MMTVIVHLNHRIAGGSSLLFLREIWSFLQKGLF